MNRIIVTLALCHMVLFVNANTYFISPSGNDNNSGLSDAQAWQSVSKVNTFNFAAGDIVSFKGGATFSGGISNPALGNGTTSNPITINSYGTGKATIDAGLAEGIFISDAGNLNINNLIITGAGYKTSGLYTCGIDIYIDSITGTSNCDYINIDNVEVQGFGGWGIQLLTEAPDYGFNHISITNCLSHDNGYGGIIVGGATDNATQSVKFSNSDVHIGYSKAYNNWGRSDFTTDWSGSGILVGGTVNGLIEYCEAYSNGKENGSNYAGPVGIFLGNSKFVTIQNCISHHNLGGPGKRDGGGFDLDEGSVGCIIQYCESYENEGAGYGLYQAATANPWSDNIVRYNTSTNDGRNYGIYGAITFWGVSSAYRVTNAQVYQNQITMTKTGYGLMFLNNNLTNVVLNDNSFCLESPASYLKYTVATPIPDNATVTNSSFPCTVQPGTPCVPVTPAAITGPINVCANINGPAAVYTIAAVPNASGYNWTVPTGATISSSQPYGTSISVSFSSSFVSGNISVQALGTCGNSSTKTLALNKSLPSTPGTITGPANACAYIGGGAVTYSVLPAANADGYLWTVPAGASITSSPPFTNAINVAYSGSFVSGNISVQAINGCGASSIRNLAVTKTVPATPGTIAGPTNLCANLGGPAVTYSIPSVSNATGYNWTVPTGATITSPQPFTTSINVLYSTSFVSGNVSVQALSACGNSPLKTLAVNKGIPSTPGTITGPTNLCANIGGPAVTYSIAAVTNAGGYNWTVPTGATITSPQPFTTSITVLYSTSFVSGNVSVQALGACGNSAFKALAVSKGIPATPGTITGPTNLCANLGGPAVTYSIAAVTNATGYNWTVPTGATITSPQPFTTSITVLYSTSFVSGNVSVQALGVCGNSAFKALAVSKGIPATPGTITGPTNLCANLGGPAVTYSIAAVTNATGYNWTVPTGATITSPQPFTTSITVLYSTSFVSGNVSVQALGVCGNSAFKTLAVNKGIPATPGTITGPINLCTNLGGPAVTYSIAAVTNATGYNWTVPAGATITSPQPFTTSITVLYSTSFVSGNVSVQALGVCGNSAVKTLAVTNGIPSTPGTITGPAFVCDYIGGPDVIYSVSKVTNATGYNWTVPAGASITSPQPYSNSISVNFSSSFISGNIGVQALSSCGNSQVKTLAVTKLTGTPSSLTGPAYSCKYVGIPVTYVAKPVTNATSYTWTVPVGAVINGSNNGPSISVTYTAAVSGNITVASTTNCGSSLPRSLAIGKVATPISITGAGAVCQNQNQNYTVYDTANDASAVYTWTLPTGVTMVSGQGSKSITVAIGPSFSAGTLSVKATACGITGSTRSLSLTTNANCPSPIISHTIALEKTNEGQSPLIIYPNPNQGKFKLQFSPKDKKAPVYVEVLGVAGKVVSHQRSMNTTGLLQLDFSENKLPAGVYLIKCTAGDEVRLARLVIQR